MEELWVFLWLILFIAAIAFSIFQIMLMIKLYRMCEDVKAIKEKVAEETENKPLSEVMREDAKNIFKSISNIL